jgi:hypothetical protein
MIPGSLFSGEFTLGLMAQIRIWSSACLQISVPSFTQLLSAVFRKTGSD